MSWLNLAEIANNRHEHHEAVLEDSYILLWEQDRVSPFAFRRNRRRCRGGESDKSRAWTE